jgi:hypothetical protein
LGRFLNNEVWIEKTVTTGIDRQTGLLTQINTVRPGFQSLTEYDLTDLNCLMEWTHSKLVQLVRHQMDERDIDDEIDFRIIRGERQNVTEIRDPQQPAEKAKARVRKLLRTG